MYRLDTPWNSPKALVCSLFYKIPAKHNNIVRQENKTTLAAQIIKPTTFLCGFSVAIAKKKDDTPTYCGAYLDVSKRLNTEKVPLPKTEEVLDDMAWLEDLQHGGHTCQLLAD